MEITGRLTADAIIGKTKNNKEVVNFSIAVNDRYKTKSGEVNTITEYFRCAFWLGTNVAKILTKGTVVALSGRASAEAWLNKEGKPQASLNFNTNNIKILAWVNKQDNTEQPAGKDTEGINQERPDADDLPF
ncbi:single-strand DNA-binding protein [Mucilaginibacter pineti]|uniref:Single-stranded DNA-binding protein n=1 Tax=Mucilaginibacter pineti TaxID=1391627 RepID=A0A1G7GEK9_9SPHI|nr:single-stranded DNA-binding protein [Mucilaginibacter pineti]SDE86588.1 single-strand DNA-binding protein [Mucilaginibacter pineti]